MYYKGYFRNTDTKIDPDGQLFKVVIITNYKNREYAFGGELMLTDSPFIVNYEGEQENIFKPYKCSTATVGIYQNNLNPSFNNSQANNVLVKLLKFKNGITEEELNTGTSRYPELVYDEQLYEVEWVGYATPNAYAQEFESELDLFEMECQDALSTLQYKNFELIKGDNGYLVTFMECILKYLSEDYSDFFISDSIQIPNDKESNFLENLLVDGRNFFDEDNTPKSVLEVIEQLCLYLNLTIIPYKNQLWILDYNAIIKGYNVYWHTNNLNLFDSKEEYNDLYNINADSFAQNGTNISFLSTYNKISVKNNIYGVQDIFPDLTDIKRWNSNGMDLDEILSDGYTYITEVNNFANVTVFANNRKEDIQYSFIRFINLNPSNNIGDDSEVLVRSFDKETHKPTTNSNCYWHLRGSICAQVIAFDNHDTNRPTKIELKPAIMLSAQDARSRRTLSEVTNGDKLIEIRSKTVTIGSGDYVVLKGTIRFYRNHDCLPIDEPEYSDELIYSLLPYSLKFNNKYLSTNFLWFDQVNYWWEDKFSVTGFRLKNPNSNNKAFNTDFNFECNISYKDLLGVDDGYAIPSPINRTENVVQSGQFELSFYTPCPVTKTVTVENLPGGMPGYTEEYKPPLCTMISNLSMELVTESAINSPNICDDNTDTEYVLSLNEETIDEKSPIELDLCTWDNKQPNYSTVYYQFSNNIKRLQHYLNKSTGNRCRAEEHICQNIIDQYSSPTISLNLNLHYQPKPYTLFNYKIIPNKQFIFDSGEFDYRYNKYNINIIEKK